jgi:lysine/ornithine N-monooxygenase
MEMVFNYASTLSLSKMLHSKSIADIAIGDVLIIGGSPGHAEIVVDVAENTAGKKVFLLAQSYMPAQETQVLKNLMDSQLSPWYRAAINSDVVTPQWTFSIDQLKTW